MKDRVILHCDLNNFFASVEMMKNPELRGKAIAVCGDPEKRHGIVLAKSESAKKCGVKTGMPIWQAKQLCPEIIILSTNHADYGKYSKVVRDIYYRYTDKIEPFGIDECWLDVSGSLKLLGKTGEEIADEIRCVVREEIGLTVSVGVSWNKTYAKFGSDLKKPDATTVITRDNYKQILFPLPVSSMIFIGKRTRAALEKLNIRTIGQLAESDPNILSGHFGINAHRMVQMARGDDDDEVKNFDYRREIKSVGNGTTMPYDLNKFKQINQVIYLLAEEVAYRMRYKGVKGTTINLSIRNKDLVWSGAQETISEPTNSANTIHSTAMKIFSKIWKLPDCIHSMRVAVSNLTKVARKQISFFEDKEQKNDKVSGAFDKIRRKYGASSVMYGTGMTGEFNLEFEVYDN